MKHKLLPLDFVTRMAEIIKVIGHPQRLQILELLEINGEQSVNTIVEAIKGQQGAISQHLNKMRLAGIIAARREGKQIFYSICAEKAIVILSCLRKKYDSSIKA